MNSENKILVEKYLAEDLTKEEKLLFEERLHNEPDLQEELALQQDMLAFLKAQEKERIRQELNLLWDEQPEQRSIVKWYNSSWVKRIAAIFCFAVLIAALIWMLPQSKKEPVLANYLKEPYPLTVLKGKMPDQDTVYQTAVRAYQKNDFALAAQHFKTLTEHAPRIDYQFYLGCSLLHQKPAEATTALQAFEVVIAQGSSIYHEQAHWYAALAALSAEKQAKAFGFLNTIITQGYWMEKEAKVLRKHLGNRAFQK